MPEQIKNKLDKTTLIKIAKGCGIAGGGAIAVYLLEMIPSINLGSSTAVLTALSAVLLNAVREYLKGNWQHTR